MNATAARVVPSRLPLPFVRELRGAEREAALRAFFSQGGDVAQWDEAQTEPMGLDLLPQAPAGGAPQRGAAVPPLPTPRQRR